MLSPGVVYGDDADNGADNREDHVDRIQARAFEGFVTESKPVPPLNAPRRP